jgi:hypothetical protein
MPYALSVFNAQVDIELSGVSDTELASASRDAQIKAALEQYSQDRPRVLTGDLTGTGSRYYALNAVEGVGGLAGWDDDFSQVLRVEWNAEAVSAGNAPEYLEENDYEVYDDGTSKYLYFSYGALSTGLKARVRYTARHAWGSGADPTTTVPARDFYAVCKLAAALCCQSLAVRYGQTMDSTLGADVVNYQSKTNFYASRAKELRAQYREMLGLDTPPRASGAFVDWDMRGGDDTEFISHPSRRR